MEFVINKADIKNTPMRSSKREDFIPGGILNSSYQKIVKQNVQSASQDSIYGIRNTVKSRTFYHATSAETIIKVLVFLIILGLIL